MRVARRVAISWSARVMICSSMISSGGMAAQDKIYPLSDALEVMYNLMTLDTKSLYQQL